MPNWTKNIVKLKGSKQDIQSIKDLILSFAHDSSVGDERIFFDFNKVIPMPEEYNEGDKWYDWRVENWGTKWNSDETEIIKDTPTELELIFNTAWSHPNKILSKLNDMFPNVDFFHEAQHEGGFGGHIAEFNSTEQKWSLQITTEIMVGKKEDGEIVELNYDDDIDEYIDEDGNIYDELYHIFVPVK
jgi:hypothetical protein